MPKEPEYEQVRFENLPLNSKFFCWGDEYLNYDFPKWCECIKVEEETGQEVDGMRFAMYRCNSVSVLKG